MSDERVSNDDIRAMFDAFGRSGDVEVQDIDGDPYAARIVAKEGVALCDFCSSRDVVVAFLTPPSDVVGTTIDAAWPGRRHRSEANWAACAPCKERIERKDRRGLVDRAERSFTIRYGRTPGLRAHVTEMHDAFWAVFKD